MATVDGTPSGGALAASHPATARHELDQTYLQSALGADAMDRWIFSSIAMGAGFAGGGVAKDFTLSLPGALATGDLTIRMYSPYELAHETSVSVNGAAVGSAVWSGIGWTEAAFAGVSLSGRGQHGVALVHGVARQDRDGLVRGGLRAGVRGLCGRAEVHARGGLPVPGGGVHERGCGALRRHGPGGGGAGGQRQLQRQRPVHAGGRARGGERGPQLSGGGLGRVEDPGGGGEGPRLESRPRPPTRRTGS